ncbi:SDR family NAD(P)-dependent oxidoreductase [Pseudonocardia alni]|uniref:SDR family NAD(P)-dependent oxidoreductase n=1 Tax=Pseudonocardia alni TaxID=33907 RepID=UPI0033E2F01F
MEFDGRTVLITGAAGGIGAAAAAAFAAEGASLALVDLDRSALEKVAAGLGVDDARVLLHVADVRDEQQVEGYVAATRDRFGAIDVFFNNAGVEGATGPLVDTDLETVDTILSVNVRGSFLGLKHVLRVMTAQGHGSVVNTSSMAGVIAFAGLGGMYTASKHAVVGLTRVAAVEAAPAGVRVNAVCPGPVDTRMMRSIENGMSPDDIPGVQEQFAGLTALKRYADPAEIASVVLFLASDRASYVSGSIYTVDAGMTGI